MERKEYEKMFNSFSNISNANINPRYFEDFAIVQRAIYTLRDEINAADKLISDHKAVVETKDEKYLSLKDCANKQRLTIETMQNKIDELENTKVGGNCTCSVKQAVIDSQKDKINELERQITYLYMGGKMSNETLDNLIQLAKGIK